MRNSWLAVLVVLVNAGAVAFGDWVEKEVDSFKILDPRTGSKSLLTRFSLGLNIPRHTEPFLEVRAASGIRKLKRKPRNVFEYQSMPDSETNLAVLLYERKEEDAFVAILLNSLKHKEIIGSVQFKSVKGLQKAVQDSMESNPQAKPRKQEKWKWNDNPENEDEITRLLSSRLEVESDTIKFVSVYEPLIINIPIQPKPMGIIYAENLSKALFPPKLVGAIYIPDTTTRNPDNDVLTIVELSEFEISKLENFAASAYFSCNEKRAEIFDFSCLHILPLKLRNPGIRVIEPQAEGGFSVFIGAENGNSFASLVYNIAPKYSGNPDGGHTSVFTITKPTLELVLNHNLVTQTFRTIPVWKLVNDNPGFRELAQMQTENLRAKCPSTLLEWIDEAFWLQDGKIDLVRADNWQISPIYYFETLADGSDFLFLLCSITGNLNDKEVQWFVVLRKQSKGNGSSSARPTLEDDKVVDIKLMFHSRSIKTNLMLRLSVLLYNSDTYLTLPPGNEIAQDHGKLIAQKIAEDYKQVLGFTVSSPRIFRCYNREHTREYVFKSTTTVNTIPVFVPVHYASDVFTIRPLYASTEEAFDDLKYPYGTLYSHMLQQALANSSQLLTTATRSSWIRESTKSLEVLLENDILKPLFLQYLQTIHCEENLKFYEDCENLKNMVGREAIRADITRIYNYYFVNAKTDINVGIITKRKLQVIIDPVEKTENFEIPADVLIFDAAQADVRVMMMNDSIPKFVSLAQIETWPKSKAPASCLAPVGIKLKT